MLSAAGYGEYQPIETNATEGQSTNRRVDIVILPWAWRKLGRIGP